MLTVNATVGERGAEGTSPSLMKAGTISVSAVVMSRVTLCVPRNVE